MLNTYPPHPGRSVKQNCLDAFGLNATEAARVLGLARHTLSRVLNGHAAISPEMAIRLEKAGRSNAEFWLRLQAAYDLARAREGEDRIRVDGRRRPTTTAEAAHRSSPEFLSSRPPAACQDIRPGETSSPGF